MAKKVKLTIDFKQFVNVAEQVARLGGNVDTVVEDCLKKSRDLVTDNLKQEMRKHHLTGDTEKSIRDNEPVKWERDRASIKVGFDIANGGLPSIFLMYGTPRMKKDKKLYNAVYGAKIKKEVKKLQQEIFNGEVNRLLGG